MENQTDVVEHRSSLVAASNKPSGFKGLHLIIDGTVVDSKTFSNHNIKNMLYQLVDALGMHLIYGPIFKRVEVDPSKLDYTAFVDSGGVSAFCMISTSHMSIHTWELTKTFQMDVFSCKLFDAEKALKIVKGMLETNELKVQLVERTQLDYS